jgi:hypothetical protein
VRLMRDEPAESGLPPEPADAIADRWHQRAGFSVFFDVRAPGRGRPGERRRRTRLYHEETGDETMLPGWGPTDWVKWMLDRLSAARPPSEPAGEAVSVVSMEIIDARLAGDPAPGAPDDTVAVELQLRVSGIAELNRTLAAKVVGILFGSDPR